VSDLLINRLLILLDDKASMSHSYIHRELKFLLIAIGTRGDIEPFLVIGEKLMDQGHEVICQFPEQFRELAMNSKVQFEGLTPDFLELTHSLDGKIITAGSGPFFKKIGPLFRVYRKSRSINHTLLMQQHKLVQQIKPDRILYSTKATYAVVWEVLNPGKTIHISSAPYVIHPVKSHGNIGFNGNYGKFLNPLTYKFANYFLIQKIVKSTKTIRKEIGVKSSSISKIVLQKKMVFTISPNLYKEQEYWPENVKVLGYHERSETRDWKPAKELTDFINSHEKILFVTFGSMTNPNPEHLTKMILRILRKNEIPAIINTAGGGLVQPGSYDSDLFHFVKQVPYHWILPKMHAIMHHGGAGTSHLAVKYGCASLIIPHTMNQNIWNSINLKLRVGPKGISVKKLNIRDLTLLILDLYFTNRYKVNAACLSEKMNKEDCSASLIDFVLN
jgi:sterol 3beta-glucosyltransferase